MYQYASKNKAQSEKSKANTPTTNKNHAQIEMKIPVQTKSLFSPSFDQENSGENASPNYTHHPTQLTMIMSNSPIQMQLIPKQERKEPQPLPIKLSEEQKRLTPTFAKPNNTGIPMQMKENFENLSGFSFDDVKVHYNSDKPAQLQALAYTQGNQVHIAPGQEKHLRHELGHVIQQKQGRVQVTEYMGAFPMNTDPLLEREADKGLFSAVADASLGLPVIQKQDGLPLLCQVYVSLLEGYFRGIIVGVSKEDKTSNPQTLYDVKIEDGGDRLFLGKDVIRGIKMDCVSARDRLMDTLDFVSLTPFNKPVKVISGEDTTITSKEEFPKTPRPVFHAPTLEKAAKEAYGKSKILDGTSVFHLGSNSGALLQKIDGVYKVVYLEKNNAELQRDPATGQFTGVAVKSDFQVDQVITTGLTGCSFIAMTDDARSFLAVAHLDVGDEMYHVIAEMQKRDLKPSLLYASIIDGTGNSLETIRVKKIAATFFIQKIRILNRGNEDQASAYSLNVIGIDLGTGKSPTMAGEDTAAASGGRSMSVFGEMGSSREVIHSYLNRWINHWLREFKPQSKLFGKNPVNAEPIRISLLSLGMQRFYEIIIFILEKLGDGDVYKGILKCSEDKSSFNTIFDIIYKPLERKAFSETL